MAVDMQKVALINRYIDLLQGGDLSGQEAKDLYFKYKDQLSQVKPQEAFEVFSERFHGGEAAAEILQYLDKIINVFYQGLSSHQWEKPAADSFLGVLRAENTALVALLDQIGDRISQQSIISQRKELLTDLKKLLAFDAHYLKKENILFPYMEKANQRFEGVAIMWSLHDEARRCLQEAVTLFAKGEPEADEASLSVAVGHLFFAMHGLVQKEELILFPTAVEVFTAVDFLEMQRQSYDYDFPLLNAADIPSLASVEQKLKAQVAGQEFSHDAAWPSGAGEVFLDSETGSLSMEQAILLFSHLTIDLSYVDENNKLIYFSKPKDRIFPRSPAALGRDVKYCHPPESVHVVEEIIEAFRRGKHKTASFWLEIKGRFILIKYFALFDAAGTYRGVLEISQDISEHRKLEGQRRLLEWDVEV